MATSNGREGSEPQDLTDQSPPDIHRPIPRPAVAPSQQAAMAPTDSPPYHHGSGIDQLSTAAACGDLTQVQQLLSNGVRVNQTNIYGRTPLQVIMPLRLTTSPIENGLQSCYCSYLANTPGRYMKQLETDKIIYQNNPASQPDNIACLFYCSPITTVNIAKFVGEVSYSQCFINFIVST